MASATAGRGRRWSGMSTAPAMPSSSPVISTGVSVAVTLAIGLPTSRIGTVTCTGTVGVVATKLKLPSKTSTGCSTASMTTVGTPASS